MSLDGDSNGKSAVRHTDGTWPWRRGSTGPAGPVCRVRHGRPLHPAPPSYTPSRHATCCCRFVVHSVDLLHVCATCCVITASSSCTASRPSRTVTRWTKTTTTTYWRYQPLLLLRSLSNAENDTSSVRVGCVAGSAVEKNWDVTNLYYVTCVQTTLKPTTTFAAWATRITRSFWC